ncbi:MULTISPECIES: HEPN domain-containing protein [Pseudomonas]|uniref:ApeA N-terminal domain-containing protein n=1 Tax=Pseudomonas quercus TaxID=2722792 RepID=A0ABX0YED0_9PSED|nr:MULTISPECIES: HEPN domain-containing protein [Pseudomonas]MBF7144986.1 hypothetical protein [Pseudomonas sp. LY10J]NJP01285.1 hypothetical protein [Pseudomonas quercus]
MSADFNKIIGCFKYGNLDVNGDLIIHGDKTLLKLRSRSQPVFNPNPHSVYGETLDRKKISLFECVGNRPNPVGLYPELFYEIDIFPHYVMVGGQHLDWDESIFESVSFKTDDLGLFFSKRGTFGSKIASSGDIKKILGEACQKAEVDGERNGVIFFYSGEGQIKPINLSFGKISTSIRFESQITDSGGVICPAETIATIKFDTTKKFSQVIDAILSVLEFLSFVSGRYQGVQKISAETRFKGTNEIDQVFLYWSLAPEGNRSLIESKRDWPISLDRDEEELSEVFKNWIEKHVGCVDARRRIIQCQKKNEFYDGDRIVGAANAFDILPTIVYPVLNPLSDEALQNKKLCKDIIMKMPHSEERSQILSTLNFWGSKLLSKILHKASVIENSSENYFNGIADVLKISLKARNYYVHGTDAGYLDYEEELAFLTDTLEFVFVASDLIECGWNIRSWLNTEPSLGHPMASYVYSYKAKLKRFNKIKSKVSDNSKT